MVRITVPVRQLAHVTEEHGKPSILKTIPIPKPGPNDILVNIKYSGVCGSDVHVMNCCVPEHAPPPQLPRVGGHEGVGVVVAKGRNVPDEVFAIGDYAGLKWINATCGVCQFCQAGYEQLCPRAKISSYNTNGSFQQYAIVGANSGNKLPRDIDLAGAAPVMCAGITVYKALKDCGARPGQYVAIIGAGGGLGCFAIQYARAMGLIPLAVSSGEAKERACKELGAAAFVDYVKAEGSVPEALRAVTPDGLGAHAALIVSSAEDPFMHASEYVRPLGTVVVVGIPADGYVKSSIWDMITRVVTIRGSMVANRAESDEAIEFYRRGLIRIPYEVIGMTGLNEALEGLSQHKVVGRIVMDMSRE